MRKKLASALIVVGLLASYMAHANAVFGLSKCEKVKKQILSYEKREITLSRQVSPFAGQLANKFTLSQNRSNYLKMKEYINFEFTYLKYAYNNSKCFTRSQNEFIDSSYRNVEQLKYAYDSTPYFLDAWQSNRMLFTYPFGNGSLISIYSR